MKKVEISMFTQGIIFLVFVFNLKYYLRAITCCKDIYGTFSFLKDVPASGDDGINVSV
jgi:hypothetical protein